MASKKTAPKEKTMPNLTVEIQAALDKIFDAGNVVDWALEITTASQKFDALERANGRYLSSDHSELVYGEGDRELIISSVGDERFDDTDDIPF